MKKIFFLLFAAIMIMPSFAHAGNVYVDGAGTYGDFKDAGTMPGFGVGLGYTFLPNTNIYVKYLMGSTSEVSGSTTTAEYSHKIGLCAIEYNFPIMNYPLFWSTSLGAGYGDISIALPDATKNPANPAKLYAKNDKAVYLGFTTGVRYLFTQHLGVFTTVGYQMMTGFAKDLINAKVAGYQLTAGVSFTLWGKNSSLTEGY